MLSQRPLLEEMYHIYLLQSTEFIEFPSFFLLLLLMALNYSIETSRQRAEVLKMYLK